MKTIMVTFLALMLIMVVQAQNFENDKTIAHSIELIESGHPDNALKVLIKANKKEPEAFKYGYYLSKMYYDNGDYNKVVKLLVPFTGDSNETEGLYDVLGKSYIALEQKEEGVKIFEIGLEKFPDSPVMHYSIAEASKEDNAQLALTHVEKSIVEKPDESKYYLLATELAYQLDYRVKTMMYAETFILMDNNGDKSEEVSKLLLDSYQKSVALNGTANFKKENGHYINAGQEEYASALSKSITTLEVPVSLIFISSIKENFVKIYYDQSGEVKAIPLMKWNKDVFDAGYMEIYSYWLLSYTSPEEFYKFFKSHKSEFTEFKSWIKANRAKINWNNDDILVKVEK
ncbi:MAG: hypothetical protein JKY42_04380 [Flavobacteriales bacterium]|nr:hypothetical protein [Flavobacteriales bacterium]